MRGSLLVTGTSSSAGKSTVVTGLCRLLARKGIDVAPFKALNMSNNAVVASDGGEIARAQYAQALAAGVPATTAMNPVLVKPLDDLRSQTLVRGRPATMSRDQTFAAAIGAFAELRAAHDVVVAEGAGGAAEVNLLDRDIANLPLARAVGMPAVLVADIDRGGALAAVVGTVELLPEPLRACLRGIVVNKFRGNRSLLEPALDLLHDRTGLPVLGVLPWMSGLVDTEDSLDLDTIVTRADPGALDVAVIRLPLVSNWSDVAPLAHDPAASVRFVASAAALGDPDLVVVPGSRSVLHDLAWLRERGIDEAVARGSSVVLGICGGYQMMGHSIVDRDGVEATGTADGLGWLPVHTEFATGKIVGRRRDHALGHDVEGFEIRHGRVTVSGDCESWLEQGARAGRMFGTTLHGLFEHDGFRRAFLESVASERGRTLPATTTSYADVVTAAHDRLADAIEAGLDVATIADLVAAGGSR